VTRGPPCFAPLSEVGCAGGGARRMVERVGWVERSETHQVPRSDGFRKSSTHPTELHDSIPRQLSQGTCFRGVFSYRGISGARVLLWIVGDVVPTDCVAVIEFGLINTGLR
jgi:hypothetical protein